MGWTRSGDALIPHGASCLRALIFLQGLETCTEMKVSESFWEPNFKIPNSPKHLLKQMHLNIFKSWNLNSIGTVNAKSCSAETVGVNAGEQIPKLPFCLDEMYWLIFITKKKKKRPIFFWHFCGYWAIALTPSENVLT